MEVQMKRLWLASIIFRILNAVWQTGYTHPDEYFQSIEVAAGDVFEVRTRLPWEFNASRPLRSLSSVGLFVTAPLTLYKLASGLIRAPLDFHVVHVLPRLVNVALSLLCDLCVLRLCNSAKLPPRGALLLLWSSSPLYTFVLRPLSNAWETFYFCGLLLLSIDRLRPFTALLQGILAALGCFCRPTFAIFAAAPFLRQLVRSWRESPARAFGLHLLLALSFALSCALCVLCDSLYFGRGLALTPLNFLAYNWRPENLQSHGRHPCFTHLLANLPQLFGAGWLLLMLLPLQSGGLRRAAPFLPAFLLPLGALSLFCHQEVRFLLPLLPLGCVLIQTALAPFRAASRRIFFSLWLLSHLCLLLFWGFTHQAGVVPALHHLRSERHGSCQLAFFLHTYMPPEFLLARPRNDLCSHIFDFASAPPTNLRAAVMAEVEKAKKPQAFLVFPTSAHRTALSAGLPIALPRCALFPFHLSSEHPPDLLTLLNRPLNETLYALKNALSLVVCPVDLSLLPNLGKSS